MAVIYLLLSIGLIILLTARYKIHPFIVLFLVAILYGICTGMPLNELVTAVNEGFGRTLGSIGLVIIFGIIIGSFLEHSGGAYKVAEKVIGITGKKRVPTAMGFIGYFVSIPVFADSGFILLSPLNKSLSKKAKISLAGSAVALGLGLTATHTMVPPTPGPIAAAGLLGADLGLVMIIGLVVSMVALVAGLIYANKYAARTYIDPIPDTDDDQIKERIRNAPGALRSSLPIFVPIVLIVMHSVLKMLELSEENIIFQFFLFAGEPIVALAIGMLLAFTLPKNFNSNMLSTDGWIGNALRDSASILLITGAGGIFGNVLQNSNIADLLGEVLATMDSNIWLPFLIAAAIKTAQGSSTVAIITTASILTPMMGTLGFESEIDKALVVVAIGAGSAVVSHANDSFFWVVSQLSGMDTKTGYRLYTTGTLVLGVSAAITLSVLYYFIGS